MGPSRSARDGHQFSEEGIKAARTLAAEAGIPARFIQCDLYDLPQHLTGQFDVVFTSHGVLSWLPDLDRWAQVIAHFLKPGGIFYIVEVHPIALLFDENRTDAELRLLYPYFQGAEPPTHRAKWLLCRARRPHPQRHL